MTNVRNFLAQGRLKTGQMNRTEAAYADHLERQKQIGTVLWYRFEGLKLRLADNTFLTIDFAVLSADGFLEMHDVKPSAFLVQDDAKVKIKVAAEMYPFRFRFAFPLPKKSGGGWQLQGIGE